MQKRFWACLVVFILASASAVAQELEGISILPGTVRRATTVRQKPAARQAVIVRLAANANVRVVSPEPRNGFLRVILDRGRQGYVPANDVEIPDTSEMLAAAASRSPCATTLNECEPHGCAEPDSKRGLFNKAKNRRPTGSRALTISFADVKSLQRQADDVVEQGTELNQEQRDSLSNFAVTNGRTGEGKLVRLAGFIPQASDPHANTGGESVNCRLPRTENNDFHISLALRSSHTEFQGIVVEMIPHNRQAEWTLAKLRKAKRRALLVMVVGGLFYDNDHVVNADPADDLRGQPKRFSLWEIHPITEFFVCERPNNACAVSNSRQWTKLEAFQ